jgi:hypothetical protein
MRIRQISFGRFLVRNFDVATEGVSDDSVSLLGRVLIPHGGDLRRVTGAVHQLHCCRAGGGGQRQSSVSKVVRTQVIPSYFCSSLLPSHLHCVISPRHSRAISQIDRRGAMQLTIVKEFDFISLQYEACLQCFFGVTI